MTIAILSNFPIVQQRVAAAVGDSVDVSGHPLSTGADVDHDGLTVVIVDGSTDIDAALGVAGAFDDRRPDVTVVLFARSGDGLASRAMQVGVRDLLTPEADDDRIREAVKRAIDVSDRRRAVLRNDDSPGNRLIMVVSPKGGAGKTTLASNLAVGLATRVPKQVALVDADLQFGDVGNALRLLADSTVRDAVAGGLRDATEVKVHLTPHRSGLFALCAPEQPGLADEITPQAFSRAVSLLAEEFRFVIVDTDPGLGERTLSVMDNATDLIFLAATDVASVRGLSKTIQALDRIGMTGQDRHFVLNRADAKVGLEVDDIAATIGMQPHIFVPSHRSLPISMNRGSPVLEATEPSPAADAFWGLVDRFLPDPGTDRYYDGGTRTRAGGLFGRRER